MAVTEGMYLFEVVVESVKCLVNSKHLLIKSDFADIFSLELRDPKQLHIVMPEPPPLPPEPPGKKGKKKPPKPKGKKGKGVVDLPPPEPVIQSGQSVLFGSSAEFLIQNMRRSALELSLWNKEDDLTFIGNTFIPWDEVYLQYLNKICNCEDPIPVFVRDDYNIFEEGTAKLMATLGMQIKLTYLKDKVTTCFRTLSEDPTIKKYLYTGLNSPNTSYICTMKTTDEIFIENSNKIENNFVQDKAKPKGPIQYASFKNAPGANLTFFSEGDYCCMNNADKPPESIYKSPETLPDIDTIVDYIRKIIVSCNDNLRMLTPRPTIRPRIKATDIDRLCYCKQTGWPKSQLAERMKKEVQAGPCPVCIDSGKKREGSRSVTYDIANIRGPCGKFDCRIARDLRTYIENLVEEDNQLVNINDIIGPCGSKNCSLAEKIQEFLRHEGVFSQGSNVEGLSTQCACVQQMQNALTTKPNTCQSVCSKDCINASDSDDEVCGGKGCPSSKKVYNVYYFTVDYKIDAEGKSSPPSSKANSPPVSEKSSKYKHCPVDCPSAKSSRNTVTCSKSVCSSKLTGNSSKTDNSKCGDITCPDPNEIYKSPADSNIVLNIDDIYNPCCVKTCDVAEKVKDLIVDAYISKQGKTVVEDDPCYCDCDCTFKLSRRTTYCAVCGGYEVEGDDLKDQPLYAKPHPCPVYHKLYDKKYIKVPNPWSDEEKQNVEETKSIKSAKSLKKTASEKPLEGLQKENEKKKTKKEGKSEKEKKVKKVEKLASVITAEETG